MNWRWPVGAAFYTSSDETGKFQLSVDSADSYDSYDLLVDDPRYVSNFAPLLSRNVDNVQFVAYERSWIAAKANGADEVALRDLCVPLTGDASAIG
jgi:hypothetical protein